MQKSVLYNVSSIIPAPGSYVVMTLKPHDVHCACENLGLDRENDHVPLF